MNNSSINTLAKEIINMFEILELGPYDLDTMDWEEDNPEVISNAAAAIGDDYVDDLVAPLLKHPAIQKYLAKRIYDLLNFADSYHDEEG